MNIRSEKLFKILSIIIFSLYLILVCWIIIFKCNRMFAVKDCYYELSKMSLLERFLREINPIGYYTNPPNESQIPFYIRDDLLNIVIFIPLGMYLSYFIKEKKMLKSILLILSLSFLLEIFQVITIFGGGSTKDIITNTFGTVIGLFLYKIIYRKSKIKLYNICSLMIIIVLIPIVIFAVINTILNMDIYIGILLRTL